MKSYQMLDDELRMTTFGDPKEEQARFFEHRIRHQLLTDPRMERVWDALHCRLRMPDRQLEELTNEVARAVDDFRSVPRRTKSEHRANFQDVARKARRLERQISRDLGAQQAGALEYIETRNLDRYLKPTERQSVRKAVKQWLAHERGLTFSEALDALSNAAERAAERMPTLPKPGARGAKGHYVALQLHAFFMKRLQSPYPGHVATITSVVTGVELDSEAVRKLCSSRRA